METTNQRKELRFGTFLLIGLPPQGFHWMSLYAFRFLLVGLRYLGIATLAHKD